LKKKILICDHEKYSETDRNNYDTIYILDKSHKSSEYKNVFFIHLPLYFMRAHKETRVLNKLIFDKLMLNDKNVFLILSLFKHSDVELFRAMRLVLIARDYCSENDTVVVKADYSNLIIPLIKILNIQLQIQVPKVTKTFQFNFYGIKLFGALLVYLFNSFLVPKGKEKNVFFLWNDPVSYEFTKPYLSNNLITYPFFGNNFYIKKIHYDEKKIIKYRFICMKELKDGIKQYFKNLILINEINIDKEFKKLFKNKLLFLEMNSMMILSLKSKYTHLQNIVGLFDTYSSIDYVTSNLNQKYNIATLCIPHGINFKYKVNYISYGVNTYTFWSKDHLDRMENNTLVKNEHVDKKITGNIVYNKTFHSKCTNLAPTKSILIVGEYFPNDDYYSSPFNEDTSKKFFDTVNKFSIKYPEVKITIRTRLSDGYYELAKQYVSDRITLSSPDHNIINEICHHDLIVSVFSNVLHEALILEKKVLQVNLFEIENYRDLAKDNLVYYADTEAKFYQTLEEWYHNKLSTINYDFHLIKYCNGCEYEKLNFSEETI